MLVAVTNPRRAPRVRTDLAIDVRCGGDLWQSVTRDFGPGGCSFVSYRPLVRDTPIEVLLRSRKLKESLVAEGRVAWSTNRRAGIAFAANHGAHAPERWFQLLIGSSPTLQAEVRKVPDQLGADELIARCAATAWHDVDLTPDEKLLLAQFEDAAVVGTLAERTQLAPAAFARALYALLDKGVVERDPGRQLN